VTVPDLVLLAIWPHALIAGALAAAGRWLIRRRHRPLELTQAQVHRVIANYERELQEDHRG
jgi:hypothetical protein